VTTGKLAPVDPDEPVRVAESARALGLSHVVVTSVTRDDLEDGGARHFVATIAAIRRTIPRATVEVLTPDFGGSVEAVHAVCDAGPDVFNHNLETVERLTPLVRDRASYRRSLAVLELARQRAQAGRVKSGLMLGLGETRGEVRSTLSHLRTAGCDVVTLGQYLAPSRHAIPVAEYITPEVFDVLGEEARALGFTHVFAGPLVRSSYRAAQVFDCC
jgi:lipoic acid synthetase